MDSFRFERCAITDARKRTEQQKKLVGMQRRSLYTVPNVRG